MRKRKPQSGVQQTRESSAELSLVCYRRDVFCPKSCYSIVSQTIILTHNTHCIPPLEVQRTIIYLIPPSMGLSGLAKFDIDHHDERNSPTWKSWALRDAWPILCWGLALQEQHFGHHYFMQNQLDILQTVI